MFHGRAWFGQGPSITELEQTSKKGARDASPYVSIAGDLASCKLKMKQQKVKTIPSFSRTDYPVGNGPMNIAVGDFTNDNYLDIAVTDYNIFAISVLLYNRKDGTFHVQQPPTKVGGSGPWGIAVGKFRKNSRNLDLAVANQSANTISILLGNGDGTFELQSPIPVGSAPQGIAVGDFTNNGHLDIAVTDLGSVWPGSKVWVLMGNGDGTFQNPQTYPVGSGPQSIAVGNFRKNNHNLDMAVTNYNDGTISVLLNNGKGIFEPQPPIPVGTKPWGIAVGDFGYSRGHLDLAITNQIDPGTVTPMQGMGDGTFVAQSPILVGSNPTGIAVGKFSNSKGELDLAVTNQGDNTISILLGNGDGIFEPQPPIPVGTKPWGIAVGDFTNDNRDDIAIANINSNSVTVLMQEK